MRSAASKAQMLEDAGYAYSLDREIYINPSTRKVFSVEFVEDKSEEDIRAGILEPSLPGGEWCFYFSSPDSPKPGVKRELLAILKQWSNGR